MGMYNRYQGNTGKVVRMEELSEAKPEKRESLPRPSVTREQPRQTEKPAFLGGSLSSLGSMLQNSMNGLETEDLILILILYLMYRESGDSELLIMMGAMFLL